MGRERVVDKIAGTADGAVETEADFAALMTAVETSPTVALAVAALAEVRKGVMTGEGPTAGPRAQLARDRRGRHRTDSSASCWPAGMIPSRGRRPTPCSTSTTPRSSASMAAPPDLFVKAIAHHVLSRRRLSRAEPLERACSLGSGSTGLPRRSFAAEPCAARLRPGSRRALRARAAARSRRLPL